MKRAREEAAKRLCERLDAEGGICTAAVPPDMQVRPTLSAMGLRIVLDHTRAQQLAFGRRVLKAIRRSEWTHGPAIADEFAPDLERLADEEGAG